MLTLRPRGKHGTLYIRGTVTLGSKCIVVPEYSSGTSDRDAASHLMHNQETKLREELMFGPAASVASGVLADAFASYLSKTPVPCGSDILRIGKLNEIIGDLSLGLVKQGWESFRIKYLASHAPGGQDRYRGVLQAAVNVHHELHDVPPIKLKAIKFNNERVRWLHKSDRDILIASYPQHVQPIITMLAFHGPRTQDALQIKWGNEGVDMEREVIRFEHMKTNVVGHVPMHPRVKTSLLPLWIAAGKPRSGHVFLNRVCRPYQDTRKSKIPGGNPLSSAHKTALKKSGIVDFTVHDWRHHWASHCIMAGVDPITVMHLGGWKSLRMVQRYVGLSVDHLKESINKLD
jgi:integrase